LTARKRLWPSPSEGGILGVQARPGFQPRQAGKMDINFESFEGAVSHSIRLVGTGIEIFGVFIIVAGIIWSTYQCTNRRVETLDYDQYKIRIGRSLLLGLEVLVAADIVKTIAIELTFTSLGLLAGLVVVRTFLSWTLVLEIEGRWPWQRQLLPMRVTGDPAAAQAFRPEN
jgi:uncharacterized membrane protein